jgi:hypothetical protein
MMRPEPKSYVKVYGDFNKDTQSMPAWACMCISRVERSVHGEAGTQVMMIRLFAHSDAARGTSAEYRGEMKASPEHLGVVEPQYTWRRVSRGQDDQRAERTAQILWVLWNASFRPFNWISCGRYLDRTVSVSTIYLRAAAFFSCFVATVWGTAPWIIAWGRTLIHGPSILPSRHCTVWWKEAFWPRTVCWWRHMASFTVTV